MSDEKDKDLDSGTTTLNVGGEPRELMFSAAARFRLFVNIPLDQIQEYVLSDNFKINAAAMLLYGKNARGKTLDEILDMFEDDGLSDIELEAIIGWVRKRTLNFMLREAEEIAENLKTVMPQATALNNTLNGMQN